MRSLSSKHALITPFLCAAFITVHAQTRTERADVHWGPELNDKVDGDFQELYGQSKVAVYMLMEKKRDLLFQKMDLDLKVVYQKPIDLEWDKKDLDLEDIYVIGDRVIVFSSLYDKKEDQNNLYMMVYNESDFSPKGHMAKIARIPAEKKRNSGSFNVLSSPTDKRVLVLINKPYDKKGKEKFGLKVYDGEMNEQWSKDVELPYTDEEFTYENAEVDDDGSVIMTGVRYAQKAERRERKREGEATYDYHLLVYTKDGDAPQDYKLDVGNKFLQDLTLSLPETGDIICAGMYSDKGTTGIKGPFFLQLDRKTKAVTHQSFGTFDHDFITAYMTDKEEKRAERKAEKHDQSVGINWDYKIHDIVHRPDGGFIMVAEEYYMYVQYITTYGQNGASYTRTIYHYVYNDIIAVNISAAGDIVWSAKVPKRQHTIDDDGYYSSYAMSIKDGNIYLVFNDTGENLFLQKGDKVKQFELKGKDALVTLATIDADGGTHREALFAPERRETILRPKDCMQLSTGQMLIYATRKKEYRFGLIDFK